MYDPGMYVRTFNLGSGDSDGGPITAGSPTFNASAQPGILAMSKNAAFVSSPKKIRVTYKKKKLKTRRVNGIMGQH